MRIYFERLDLARNDFERCLKIDPRHREARLALADVLVQMKEPAQALDVFQEIVDEDPSDHAAVLGLARANRSLGHDEKALKIIETLSTSDPDKPEVQAERGQILFELKRYSEAEDWLKKGHGNQVFDGTTVYKLYLCLKELGKTEEAEKYFAQKESMERDAKRLKALVQQLAEHPRDSSLRHETGAILLRAGNESEALRWLNSALTLDPNYKPTHELLAEFYRSKGEIQQAEAHERRVRGETDPPSSGSGRGH